MQQSYYPGCTLRTQASGYDRSGRAVAAALGIELKELPEWQCCGAQFPLAVDDSLALVAPARVLGQAREAGDSVVTLCAICFHVLRRSQVLLERDEAMLERINWFIEQSYTGDVRVLHMLGVLRDSVGWETIEGVAVRGLEGLRVAPYYGCLLLRPHDEMGLDDPEEPSILHDLVRALGAEAVDFPFGIECCGSYLIAREPGVPAVLAHEIIESARETSADVIVTACPLCQFNLDYAQRSQPGASTGSEVPIVYFTQLMAVAMDLPETAWGLDAHYVDARPLLRKWVSSEACR